PNSWATIGCLFKFLISKVIPIEIQKIIYLDADIIVNLDIAELWQVDLDEYPLAGVPEIFNGINTAKQFLLVADGLVEPEDYFNAGVLLMNLKILRTEETLQSGIRFAAENPRYQFYMDQDIFNYCFPTRALHLPKKFNRFVYHATLNNAAIEKNIYHYVPKPQALGLSMNNPFNRLWFSYFIKTPFFDESTIGRLYGDFEQIHVELKNSMTKLSAMMSSKTRAFFTLPHNVEATKEIFSVHDDEDIILAENQASLQKLIDAMKLSQGKKVFFILLPNFPFAALTQAGFVYGKDFLNGLEFLSAEHDLPLNSYRLIQAM
ncbi:MAG: hypothetical protein IJP68_10250, partial [Selenomonadaceae bacterium]|nr:hypothetical protein [Selenomonadaceae bacterium]